MPVTTEHMKWRRHRSQISNPISETDPNPQINSLIQSTRCKSTISSLLLSTFSANNTSNETAPSNTTSDHGRNRKKKNSFRGFGCTAGASQQVSVPAAIRTSADWEGKEGSIRRKKHKRRNSGKKNGNSNSNSGSGSSSNKTCPGPGFVVDGANDPGSTAAAACVDFQDVWCGPGIGFSADAAATPVDCVVARKNVSARGKLDVEKIAHSHRERASYLGRRTLYPESISFLDNDPDIFTARPGFESFGTARYYRHLSHPSSDDGFAEIMMLQGNHLPMGGRLNSHDQFRDWRLDVDNMSYEQLLELGERIGHVNTGLKEDELGFNIRKIKLMISNDTWKHLTDKKCSICQEEYEADEELGRLNCEHCYHFQCIKQWLGQKNFCPVCKQEVVVRR